MFKGLGDSFRGGGRDLYPPLRLIEGNLEIEGLENLALDLRRCRPKVLREVRKNTK